MYPFSKHLQTLREWATNKGPASSLWTLGSCLLIPQAYGRLDQVWPVSVFSRLCWAVNSGKPLPTHLYPTWVWPSPFQEPCCPTRPGLFSCFYLDCIPAFSLTKGRNTLKPPRLPCACLPGAHKTSVLLPQPGLPQSFRCLHVHACQGQAAAGQGHCLFTVIARGT